MTTSGSAPGDGEGRAVSDLIGFVLIFSLVVSVVGIVSITGMDTLESAREAEQVNNAEQAMEVLADNMADLYERGAPSRATEISLNDADMYMDEPITVRIWDSQSDKSFDETYEVRPIVYRGSGDTRLVYAMGAVFRVQSRSGVVVREWAPVFQRDRVMVPVLNTSSKGGGSQAIQSSTVLVRANTRKRIVAVANESYGQEWTIRIDSPRRDLWQRMLEQRNGFSCSQPAPDAVTCTVSINPDGIFVVETRATVALKR